MKRGLIPLLLVWGMGGLPLSVQSAPVAPDALRPCCALGMDLRTSLLGVPLPWYRIPNVLDTQSLGHHHYNDSVMRSAGAVLGLGDEKNGLLVTRDGGILDTAHIRDTADNTFYLYQTLLPRLGQAFSLVLVSELGLRHVVLRPFTPPKTMADRRLLAARMAALIAFQLAEWHEIAQWYGYRSVPAMAETVSAFSPEDLYSNLLGARLSSELLREPGAPVSAEDFNHRFDRALRMYLAQAGVYPEAQARQALQQLDGVWWDSTRRLPDRRLVLQRNYQLGWVRTPMLPPNWPAPGRRLWLASRWQGQPLSEYVQLQIWPDKSTPASLKAVLPQTFWTRDDFVHFATAAEQREATWLAQSEQD
ncbi:DUF4056 domain-containing protein [Plesiomonas shigelloides]|uniref:DUF4056 domain-containing protein n=1 Tax=Plesiomonas shigelloides TaxID=703 RepID=UPI001261EDB8|nr:DUF4056 domain-containing protein [Plesiomonas shigelloides]KAB7697544.1 DUF4056 domain-containing protein [Plesiomonas shigelloides]